MKANKLSLAIIAATTFTLTGCIGGEDKHPTVNNSIQKTDTADTPASPDTSSKPTNKDKTVSHLLDHIDVYLGYHETNLHRKRILNDEEVLEAAVKSPNARQVLLNPEHFSKVLRSDNAIKAFANNPQAAAELFENNQARSALFDQINTADLFLESDAAKKVITEPENLLTTISNHNARQLVIQDKALLETSLEHPKTRHQLLENHLPQILKSNNADSIFSQPEYLAELMTVERLQQLSDYKKINTLANSPGFIQATKKSLEKTNVLNALLNNDETKRVISSSLLHELFSNPHARNTLINNEVAFDDLIKDNIDDPDKINQILEVSLENSTIDPRVYNKVIDNVKELIWDEYFIHSLLNSNLISFLLKDKEFLTSALQTSKTRQLIINNKTAIMTVLNNTALTQELVNNLDLDELTKYLTQNEFYGLELITESAEKIEIIAQYYISNTGYHLNDPLVHWILKSNQAIKNLLNLDIDSNKMPHTFELQNSVLNFAHLQTRRLTINQKRRILDHPSFNDRIIAFAEHYIDKANGVNTILNSSIAKRSESVNILFEDTAIRQKIVTELKNPSSWIRSLKPLVKSSIAANQGLLIALGKNTVDNLRINDATVQESVVLQDLIKNPDTGEHYKVDSAKSSIPIDIKQQLPWLNYYKPQYPNKLIKLYKFLIIDDDYKHYEPNPKLLTVEWNKNKRAYDIWPHDNRIKSLRIPGKNPFVRTTKWIIVDIDVQATPLTPYYTGADDVLSIFTSEKSENNNTYVISSFKSENKQRLDNLYLALKHDLLTVEKTSSGTPFTLGNTTPSTYISQLTAFCKDNCTWELKRSDAGQPNANLVWETQYSAP